MLFDWCCLLLVVLLIRFLVGCLSCCSCLFILFWLGVFLWMLLFILGYLNWRLFAVWGVYSCALIIVVFVWCLGLFVAGCFEFNCLNDWFGETFVLSLEFCFGIWLFRVIYVIVLLIFLVIFRYDLLELVGLLFVIVACCIVCFGICLVVVGGALFSGCFYCCFICCVVCSKWLLFGYCLCLFLLFGCDLFVVLYCYLNWYFVL